MAHPEPLSWCWTRGWGRSAAPFSCGFQEAAQVWNCLGTPEVPVVLFPCWLTLLSERAFHSFCLHPLFLLPAPELGPTEPPCSISAEAWLGGLTLLRTYSPQAGRDKFPQLSGYLHGTNCSCGDLKTKMVKAVTQKYIFIFFSLSSL